MARATRLLPVSLFLFACGGSSATQPAATLPPPAEPVEAAEPPPPEPAPEPVAAEPPVPGDPLEVGAGKYRLAFEDENVRVMDVTFQPGDTIGLHQHPDHAVYVVGGGKLKVTTADGSEQTYELGAGQSLFLPAEAHGAENVGDTEVKLAVVELRKPEGGMAAPKGKDAVKAAPRNYKQVFENERVRVLEVTFKPGAKLPMHAHPDHTAYVVSGGRLRVTPAADKAQELDLEPGQAFFLPAQAHSAVNPGKTEVKAIVFEIKPTASAAAPE
jgi:beta-alanine degradation protein BauB